MKHQDESRIEYMIYNYIDDIKNLFFKGKKLSLLMDYSKNEVLTILFMYRKKVSNVSEIAEYIEAPLNTATGVINRLEKKNIVERRRDSEDKRVVKIILTENGEQLCSHERDVIASYVRKIMAVLDDEEKAASVGIINKIIKALGNDEKEEIKEKAPKKIKRITIE